MMPILRPMKRRDDMDPTGYQIEQKIFAKMQEDLQKQKAEVPRTRVRFSVLWRGFRRLRAT